MAIAEFTALRAELLKHIELQFQLVGVSVVALGTILSVGYQTKNAAIMSLYPVLAMILGLYWLNLAHAIMRCGTYIKTYLEPRMPAGHIGWEHYIRRNPLRYDALGYWGVRGTFLGGSVATVLSTLGIIQWSASDIVALGLGVLAMIATFVVFFLWRERVPGLPAEL
ncbi:MULTISPECIES: hypothetical protein [unclassified Crossiella]|uniref:hypothetical protein n=1 Tax=unclassified Crossiella TaxID=2620835 RepID=UPI001FFF31C4|nr:MULTISPECIES: hypothetical protein [unclassified Crossiella]MCK2241769.1 hypothetical protein [Crossiella sp. S99.2]MCK2255359.1 hypothetical protein [Crossiella sp. S99.1]